jgi:hypothetical protein
MAQDKGWSDLGVITIGVDAFSIFDDKLNRVPGLTVNLNSLFPQKEITLFSKMESEYIKGDFTREKIK